MPGLINNELVSFVDILPTIVEIAGGKSGIGNALDGKSLVPLLQNKPVKLHDYLYAAYTNQGVVGGNEYPIRAVFNSNYKLVINVQHENGFHVARMDARDPRALVDSYSVLQSWLEKGAGTPEHARAMYHWRRPLIELYDMENDPYELVNLGDNPGYQNEVRLLLSELIEWMKKQHDPLTERVIERTRDIN